MRAISDASVGADGIVWLPPERAPILPRRVLIFHGEVWEVHGLAGQRVRGVRAERKLAVGQEVVAYAVPSCLAVLVLHARVEGRILDVAVELPRVRDYVHRQTARTPVRVTAEDAAGPVSAATFDVP